MDIKKTICDANNIYDAYLKSIANSKWKESTQKFMLSYLRQIFLLQKELENMTYKPGAEGEFILRERGKIRPITSLQPRDRIVRHLICDYILMPEVRSRLIYDNGSSLQGKGISFAYKRFKAHLRKYFMSNKTNEGYILFGDFSRFYDNIIHDAAKEQLLEMFDYDPFLTWLLDMVFDNFKIDVSYMSDDEFDNCLNVKFDKLKYRELDRKTFTKEKFMAKSVNIGDQISQIIGVFYPSRIDSYIKTVRSQKYYGRYMDDWYIMSPSKEELCDIYGNIKLIAADLGIYMNDKKTRIVKMSGTYRFLQVKYTLTETGKIIEQINPKRITTLKRKLNKLKVQMEDGKIVYEDIECMFRSYMGSYYKIMSREQRLNLLTLFEDLFSKSINVVNGKLVIDDLFNQI